MPFHEIAKYGKIIFIYFNSNNESQIYNQGGIVMNRQTSIWKRIIYGILVIAMVMTSCNWSVIIAAAEGIGQSAAYQVSFGTVTASGATLTPEQNGEDGKDGSFYMIPNSQQILLTVNLQPDFTTGYVRGQTLEMTLPYLYFNDESGLLVQVSSWEQIPQEKRIAGEYIGMQAKVNDKRNFGNSAVMYDVIGIIERDQNK